MSSIQQVFNSVDLRRKIFNFKTQPKKDDWVLEIMEAKMESIFDLEECFDNVLTNAVNFDGEPIYDYVEFDWYMRQDKCFTAFFWLKDEIISQKLQQRNLKNIKKLKK